MIHVKWKLFYTPGLTMCARSRPEAIIFIYTDEQHDVSFT